MVRSMVRLDKAEQSLQAVESVFNGCGFGVNGQLEGWD
jgi:hypothetical protein